MQASLESLDGTDARVSLLVPWGRDSSAARHEPWTPDASMRYCLALARGHYENFPVVFAGMSRTRREALAAIYAFARHADDFADEPAFEGVRDGLLDAWEKQLDRCFEGDASHPVFIALGVIVRRHALDPQPFRDLLDAFRQDLRQRRYGTFDEVLHYCRRSANPVGRLVLDVLDLRSNEYRRASDCVCTALQLTNFWQDLSVDTVRDRLYLPLEDLARFGIPPHRVLAREATERFDELISLEIDRTRALFDEGRPLLSAPMPGALYFGSVMLGGRAMLGLVQSQRRSILHRRPCFGPRAVPGLAAAALRACVKGGMPWTR